MSDSISAIASSPPPQPVSSTSQVPPSAPLGGSGADANQTDTGAAGVALIGGPTTQTSSAAVSVANAFGASSPSATPAAAASAYASAAPSSPPTPSVADFANPPPPLSPISSAPANS